MKFATWVDSGAVTQADVARKLGTTRQAVNQWYLGKTQPGTYYTLAIQIISRGVVPMEEWLDTTHRLALEALRASHG